MVVLSQNMLQESQVLQSQISLHYMTAITLLRTYLVCSFLSLFYIIMFGAPELWWWGALANLWIWFDVS